jgi:hypothetical protein
VVLTLSFDVWIAMGHIGGVSPASSKLILITLFIDLNVGEMGHSKMFLYVTWGMFLRLAIHALVVSARTMKTCLEIDG